MLRVTKPQLKQLLLICDHLDTITTKHGIFISVCAEDEKNYKRFLRGDMSKRQQNKLYWANVKKSRGAGY